MLLCYWFLYLRCEVYEVETGMGVAGGSAWLLCRFCVFSVFLTLLIVQQSHYVAESSRTHLIHLTKLKGETLTVAVISKKQCHECTWVRKPAVGWRLACGWFLRQPGNLIFKYLLMYSFPLWEFGYEGATFFFFRV